MKYKGALIIFILSLLCINLNAQVFVGGSVRLNTTNANYESTDPHKTTYYDILIAPSVGKFLSEKLALGFDLDFSFNGTKTDLSSGTTSRTSNFGVNPFLRYYVHKWNKFSVFGEGNIGIQFSRSRNITGGVTTDGPKTTILFLSILPGLSYDLTSKISLETSLNIFSFGYNYNITKNGSSTDKSSGLNFGAGLGNILSIGAITIRGIYRF